jgi:hypothetical protein
MLTSCIKHWGLGGCTKCSAPHLLLQRQTGTKPAIPNILYMYPLGASLVETLNIDRTDKMSYSKNGKIPLHI